MLNILIFFILFIFLIRILKFIFKRLFVISGHSKTTKESNIFNDMINEILENMKKQQEFFNKNNGQYQNYSSSNNPKSNSSISKKEAFEILGLNESASDEEIRSKYRAMMLKYHPDTGGNEYFSKKISDARDILLKK